MLTSKYIIAVQKVAAVTGMWNGHTRRTQRGEDSVLWGSLQLGCMGEYEPTGPLLGSGSHQNFLLKVEPKETQAAFLQNQEWTACY